MAAETLEAPTEATEAIPRHSDTVREESTTEKEIHSQELEKAQSNLTRIAAFPKEMENRVRGKLDWNIVPLITVVYMLSVLDRSNVGNARIAGMATDLNLVGNKYQWLLTIFYIPCTPPSLDILN